MATYFIVGASRGIGFAFVKALASANNKVIAGVRDPASVSVFSDLLKQYPSTLSTVIIDMESDGSVKEAATQISVTHPAGIDYLIINGAHLGSKDLSTSNLLAVMNVNVAGPLRVINEFLHLVRRSNRKVVVTISSIGGSTASQAAMLSYYHSCGVVSPFYYAYRTSKAALNFMTHVFAKDHEHEGIIFVPVSPGMVETKMFDDTGGIRGEHNGITTITPDESAAKQIELFHKLTIQDSGNFFNYDGNLLPL